MSVKSPERNCQDIVLAQGFASNTHSRALESSNETKLKFRNCSLKLSNLVNSTFTVQIALESQERWSHGALTGGGDVPAAVESGGEDVLGAVEEEQRGRKLPRLSPCRHRQSRDLEPEAFARALGGSTSSRRCFAERCVEEEMPHP